VWTPRHVRFVPQAEVFVMARSSARRPQDAPSGIMALLTGLGNAVQSPRPQAQASVPTAREASQCFRISVMTVPEWAD
jgi:hypothetical protein